MPATSVVNLQDYIYKTQRVTGADADEPVYQYVRLNPQVLTATFGGTANTPPDPTDGLLLADYAHVGRKRSAGVAARLVVIARYVGTAPNLVELRRRIVILDPALFYTIISSPGQAISYQAQTDWILIGNRPESYRLGRSAPISA